MTPSARKTGLRILGGLAALTACVAVAHLPIARPLLHLLRGLPACPVSLDGADPAKTEALRREALQRKTGPTEPRALAASIFTLSQPRWEVEALLEARGASCQELRQASVLRCAELDLGGGALVQNAHLQFDGRDRLVAVDLQSRRPCAPDILTELRELSAAVEERVGPVTLTHGVMSSAFLTEAPFRRIAQEFRYSGYNARLVALNTPAGLRLRQSYQWIPPEEADGSGG